MKDDEPLNSFEGIAKFSVRIPVNESFDHVSITRFKGKSQKKRGLKFDHIKRCVTNVNSRALDNFENLKYVYFWSILKAPFVRGLFWA